MPDVQTTASTPVTDKPSSEVQEVSDGVQASGNAIETVQSIIAEQTGYTTDMLEDDLDLEADLGIDTVKQVEIFAKVASHFSFAVPDDLKLRDLNTIAKLADYINTKIETSKESQSEQIPLTEISGTSKADEAQQAKDITVPSSPDDDFPDPANMG